MSNFAAALGKLKKFNAFVAKDEALRSLFLRGEYNFLQAYQLPLFLDLASSLNKKDYAAGLDGGKRPRAGAVVRLRQLAASGISLLSYLYMVVSQRRVLVFAADKRTSARHLCDFRMENLYGQLFGRDEKFAEVLHTLFGPEFVTDALHRRRPVLYLEAIDTLYKLLVRLGLTRPLQLPLSSIDFAAAGDDAELFLSMARTCASWVGRSRFRIRFFRRLLPMAGIKVLLAASDTRNCNELVAACNELGIKTYGFQSGNLNKYDVGYLDYGAAGGRLMKPRVLFVETAYWKRELLRLGTYFSESELEVGGNMKEDYAPAPESRQDAGGPLTVLIPYETFAPKDEILAYIKKLLACPGLSVVFKFRADRNLAAQAREYGVADLSGNLTLITRLSEIDRFDVAAGTYSTFLYEMVGKCKPVAYLKTSFDLGEGLLINGLAQELDSADPNFEGVLEGLRSTSFEVLRERKEKLFDGAVPLAKTLDAILS